MAGKPAACLSSMTSHGTPLAPGPGSETVLIGKLPAWRAIMDFHACPMFNGPAPHVGGMVMKGSNTVLINKMPAVRMGDNVEEIPGGSNSILMGIPNVLIGD